MKISKISNSKKTKCPKGHPYFTKPDGSRGCHKCLSASAKRWRKKNKDKLKPKSPEQNRRRHLKRRYGITEEDYIAMVIRQFNVCGICDEPAINKLVIDHCHSTGTVRGLLCEKCNKGIGHLNDSISILQAAIKYLNNGNKLDANV